MNDDFEIKVTTNSAEKKECGCHEDENGYDYEYEDMMNFNQGDDHPETALTPQSTEGRSFDRNEISMWEDSFETMEEHEDDCFMCEAENQMPIEDCGTPRVVTYQKRMTCEDCDNCKRKTVTIRITKRY